MRDSAFKEATIIIALAFVGWALCGAIMFVGMAVTTLGATLIVHAIGAPVVFAGITWFYFSRVHRTSPLRTTVYFLLVVVSLDFFLVALVINRSLEMFRSPLGTWIPFALIFIATYVTARKATASEGKRQLAS